MKGSSQVASTLGLHWPEYHIWKVSGHSAVPGLRLEHSVTSTHFLSSRKTLPGGQAQPRLLMHIAMHIGFGSWHVGVHALRHVFAL
eukprot:CAMPEP_0184517414 /NCGR_PEP_ID=MMETSP0198_2-20121128/5546_1 /TAXON_ID=1112570 /ORGANISM="Thraustochytrium sp., Strain LLF1b" /LENGTH=85 /DNA_ID=CAMNT_0026907793 /DNA_START=337 /DNA_END=594 /DNA_ORIENTATION=-